MGFTLDERAEMEAAATWAEWTGTYLDLKTGQFVTRQPPEGMTLEKLTEQIRNRLKVGAIAAYHTPMKISVPRQPYKPRYRR